MSSSIKVKFLVDSEQKRVVFAEAGRDFVDVLFSFLTLPLGSIVQLLSKQSGLGSLDNLYKSVEQLDAKCMQTDACKEMLLYPRSAAAIQCENLKIRVTAIQSEDLKNTGIYERNPRRFYTCGQVGCLTKSTCYFTYTTDALCSHCGKLMDTGWLWRKETSDEGVFVSDAMEFMITDDLRVVPSSSMNGFSILKEMQIEDGSILQEITIDFGWKEALDLLRRSLVSKTALTEVCFPDAYMLDVPDFSSPIKEETVLVNEVEKLISLELVLNKRNNNVLYVEAGGDFVNLMFSFLILPLGLVFRILSDKPSLYGCIKNLYSSVEQMGLDCFKSETCRNMLMNPKLFTFHGFKNQILELEEITPTKLIVQTGCCAFCYLDFFPNLYCNEKMKETEFIEQNPKSLKGVSDNGGAFVSGSRKYMVTDTLHISPLSFATVMGNGMNFPISDLVRKEVFVNKRKALSLLSAIMMGSKAVLTDVFFPKSMRRRIS